MTRIKKGLLFLVGFASFTTALGDGLINRLHTTGTEKKSIAPDLIALTQLADKGDALAQTKLGVMYFHGGGVAQDYQQALDWFRKAADKGHAGAQTNLGLMYSNALGLPQDSKKAAYWYQKAAAQGYPVAYLNLGVLYSAGEGVRQDLKQALISYQKAAYQGNPHAQYRLGTMYANGNGVPHDDKKAVFWYAKAAEQGLSSAQFNLGMKYLNGEGVSQNVIEGYKLLMMASFDAGKKSMDSRELVSDGTTQDLIDDTQRLSETWALGSDVQIDERSSIHLIAEDTSDI
ncbi:sel1 repeat family protein [Undibacterium sp. Jales W-56]|uniref:tetratricopeptide repeat protein n=1 Tax=Undibacterium sp. Jales W-56 TaxID=2897325 RepID=UPI0021D2C50C|nr:tetratricopeptide repeat protein [Undibacterium sp. Jales W-56]MCU6432801.1 sel1 repeat family protein [Undibacterium sp. Jales W-56]